MTVRPPLATGEAIGLPQAAITAIQQVLAGDPEVEAVILYGSRARGTARPDSDVDLLVTVPDEWLATHSRFEETDALGWKLAHHRLPIALLLFSASEVEERRHGWINVIAEAFRYGRRLESAEPVHGAGCDVHRFSAHCAARRMRSG